MKWQVRFAGVICGLVGAASLLLGVGGVGSAVDGRGLHFSIGLALIALGLVSLFVAGTLMEKP